MSMVEQELARLKGNMYQAAVEKNKPEFNHWLAEYVKSMIANTGFGFNKYI